MAVAAQTSVTTEATLIVAGVPNETRQLILHGSDDIYIGGSSAVTTSNGFLLEKAKSDHLELILHPNEEVWGIVASTTRTAYSLITEL